MFSSPENWSHYKTAKTSFFLFVSLKNIPFYGIPFYAVVTENYLEITELKKFRFENLLRDSFQKLFLTHFAVLSRPHTEEYYPAYPARIPIFADCDYCLLSFTVLFCFSITALLETKSSNWIHT